MTFFETVYDVFQVWFNFIEVFLIERDLFRIFVLIFFFMVKKYPKGTLCLMIGSFFSPSLKQISCIFNCNVIRFFFFFFISSFSLKRFLISFIILSTIFLFFQTLKYSSLHVVKKIVIFLKKDVYYIPLKKCLIYLYDNSGDFKQY